MRNNFEICGAGFPGFMEWMVGINSRANFFIKTKLRFNWFLLFVLAEPDNDLGTCAAKFPSNLIWGVGRNERADFTQ